MRIIFGVLSLLVVVAIVGVLAKKQLGSASGSSAPPERAATSGVAAPTGTPKQQVDQVKQSVEGVMQQARPMPEDDKK